jgi:hypothetical protein
MREQKISLARIADNWKAGAQRLASSPIDQEDR